MIWKFGGENWRNLNLLDYIVGCPVLASSLVFNLADGQFSSRADLIDAPGSSLGRGAQVAGLGELNWCHIGLLYVEFIADSHILYRLANWHFFILLTLTL